MYSYHCALNVTAHESVRHGNRFPTVMVSLQLSSPLDLSCTRTRIRTRTRTRLYCTYSDDRSNFNFSPVFFTSSTLFREFFPRTLHSIIWNGRFIDFQ